MSAHLIPARRPAARVVVTLLSAALVIGALPAAGSATEEPAPEPTPTSSAAVTQFREDLVAIYAKQLEFLEAAGAPDPSAPPVEDYRAEVMAMPDEAVAEVSETLEAVPQWSQLPAMLETMITSLPASSAEAVSFAASAPDGETGPSTIGGGDGSASRTASSGEPGPVALHPVTSCEYDDIPAAAVYSTQIVLDIASTAGELLDLAYELFDTQGAQKIAKKVVFSLTFIAKTVAGVAAIITDTLAYLRGLNSDCTVEDIHAYNRNIDNTTVATFRLVESLGAAMTRIEKASGDTLLAVQDLDVDLSAHSSQIQKTLQQNLTDVQNSIGGSTQLNVDNLRLLQAALQQGLTALSGGVSAAKDEILTSDGAAREKVERLLADSLTRTIAEVDRTTSQIRGNLDARTQLVLDSVQRDAAASRSESSTDLRLAIEQALASGHRRTLLRLPAEKGGLLDARPLGVQSIVNDGMKAMLEMGAGIEPMAVRSLNDGNTAVSERRWLAAYFHFEAAYQGMINAR